jgi:hypothetical protein
MDNNLNPLVGELWEVLILSENKKEKPKQLRLIKKTEVTYSFSDPDTDPYCPILFHVLIEKCKLIKKIAENEFTKINGIPDMFYENRTTKNKLNTYSFNWSIDKDKYLSGDTSPN